MIQPLELNSLFDLLDNKKIKVKSAAFLSELLKNLDNKDLIKTLILKSNLPQKDKNILLKKFDIKNTDTNLENIEEILNKEITNSNILKETIPSLKNFNLNTKIDSHSKKTLKITSFLSTLIDKDNKPKLEEIKDIPLNFQIEIVKEIKNILISKAKSDNVIKNFVSTKEFKEVKNLKDLLILSQKFNLNLKKIVIKQIKPEINNENLVNLNVINKVVMNKKIEKNISKNSIKNNINENIKIKKKDKKLDLSSLINKKLKPQQDNKLFESKETSLNNFLKKDKAKTHLKDENELASINEIKSNFIYKTIKAKESIKHFVSSLKEAVENYKPPITKLSLELHPKELGKVEVVIKQQGDNLNIQVNTQNQTTINFLTSQQQELKNSLVNMGFTNINMNFNFNEKREKNQQNQYQSKKNIAEEDELVIDFTYKYA